MRRPTDQETNRRSLRLVITVGCIALAGVVLGVGAFQFMKQDDHQADAGLPHSANTEIAMNEADMPSAAKPPNSSVASQLLAAASQEPTPSPSAGSTSVAGAAPAPAASQSPTVSPPAQNPVVTEATPPGRSPRPPRRPRSRDLFELAAKFKPSEPLTEFPPLPPVNKRPALLLEPGGHTAFVRYVFFTPDNTQVISVSDDKTIRSWDIVLGELIYTVPFPSGPDIEGRPQGAALSPDGKTLAVSVVPIGLGKQGIPIYLIDVETGELRDIISDCPGMATCLDFSRDGQWLMTGTETGALGVFDLGKKKWIFMLPHAHESIEMVSFNPGRPTLIASLGRDSMVRIWDMAKTEPLATVSFEKPNCIDWMPDGSSLGVGCTNGEISRLSLEGKRLPTIPPYNVDGIPVQIVRMRFMPDGKNVVSGGVGTSGWTGVKNIASAVPTVDIRDHRNTVMAVNVSNDGQLAVSAGGESNEILVWRTTNGQMLRRFEPQSQSIWAIGWSKDGKSVAWGNTNLRAKGQLCPLESSFRFDNFQMGRGLGNQEYQQDQHTADRLSIHIDDFFQFTVSENGRNLYQHKSLSDRIYSVTVVPGKGIVVGASHRMYLLEARTGTLIREFIGDQGLTTAVAPSPDSRYFVSGSTDQVLRIWSPEETEPLLSLFAVGREWIAWTPRGYYACSAVGERLIAWQVNEGITKLPSVHPAALFHASLYQPGLLKFLVPAGNLPLALAMAREIEKQRITATELAAALPPSVSVTVPTAVDDRPFVVEATADGDAAKPILSMRLLVDGRTHMGEQGIQRFTNQQTASAKWNVSLGPGVHTITVLAETPLSKGQSRVARVKRDGVATNSRLFVLAVGVAEYPEGMKLQFSASDARHFTESLKKKAAPLFKDIETKIVLDKDATLKNIRGGLQWLNDKMTPEDVGVVFFSGHGGRSDDDRFYLIPVDVSDSMEASCLPGDEVRKRLEQMPGRLIAVLDACHSGSITDESSSDEPVDATADDLVRDLVSDECGVVVLTSSLGSEYSLESSSVGFGYFTLGLVEGLERTGDLNHDGFIYINELARFAAARVIQLSKDRQHPTVGRSPQLRPFPIARP
ncbi:MAG: caspase family protein [Planctomycetaceae bacterium]|nr:caspase family protein [Planctomycetaceae bacterium]